MFGGSTESRLEGGRADRISSGQRTTPQVSTRLIHRSVHSHPEVPEGSDVDHRIVIHSGLWIARGLMFHVKRDFSHPGPPPPDIADKVQGPEIRLELWAQQRLHDGA